LLKLEEEIASQPFLLPIFVGAQYKTPMINVVCCKNDGCGKVAYYSSCERSAMFFVSSLDSSLIFDSLEWDVD
jgi:hypothetical protein